MSLQLLEELGHNHGVFSAGNTDTEIVPFLNQLKIVDGFSKGGKNGFFEFFSQAFFNLFPSFLFGSGFDFHKNILSVAAA